MRTLLVVSDRPHPWAFLRDRLPPDLVTVAWARPRDAGAAAALGPPWMLAGDGPGPLAGLERLRGLLFACQWVGPAPADLPAPPVPRDDWRQVAADAERGLAVRLAGMRLAPAGGLVLPCGSFLPPAPALEALLSAHPEGLALGGADRRRRQAVRGVARLLERHRLPLRLRERDGRVMLEPREPGGDRPA
jgi:hypothetical protein